MGKLRLINETGIPYDWKLLDEEGNNIFQQIMVTSLRVDSAGELPKLILEVPIYPDGINADVAIIAESIGIRIIEHQIVKHDLEKDE